LASENTLGCITGLNFTLAWEGSVGVLGGKLGSAGKEFEVNDGGSILG